MENEKIITKIQGGLKNCCEKYKIKPNKLRFRLVGVDDLKCYLYDESKPHITNGLLTKVSIQKSFNLSILENIFVQPYLVRTLKNLAKTNNIYESNVSVFIFEKNQTIAVILLDGNKKHKELTIDEFLNK